MEEWDRLKLIEDEAVDKRTAFRRMYGLCTNCPDSYATPDVTFWTPKGRYKYRQCEMMCRKHFKQLISTINAICYPLSGNKITDLRIYRI